ncbi:hypothetical protein ACFLRC_02620, partial [Candidatus Altiarchaeota archaeon]
PSETPLTGWPIIPKGDHFLIHGEICSSGSQQEQEENAAVDVKITYNAMIGGTSTTRTASGIIKGPVN